MISENQKKIDHMMSVRQAFEESGEAVLRELATQELLKRSFGMSNNDETLGELIQRDHRLYIEFDGCKTELLHWFKAPDWKLREEVLNTIEALEMWVNLRTEASKFSLTEILELWKVDYQWYDDRVDELVQRISQHADVTSIDEWLPPGSTKAEMLEALKHLNTFVENQGLTEVVL
jgi:hypothetical protein